MKQNTYYVSRQHYYYSGALAVEIAAGGIDYAGCDMLVSMSRLETSYDDPREAVRAAIALQALWQGKEDDHVWLAYGHNLDMFEGSQTLADEGYADGGCAYSDDELVIINRQEAADWAETEYTELPKCDRCGDLRIEAYHIYDDPDAGVFCSEYCANEVYADMFSEADSAA